MGDNYNRKKNLLKTTVDKNKKGHKKLLNEELPNNTNSKHSINSQKVKEKRKKQLDQTEKKKKYNISNNKRTNISNSTPLSKKLPDKAHVFHEMLPIIKEK